ncbi:Ubiquitin family [Popillia japonica]|uniref:very-long-chain enoyl-CoA reductase n=1 Tax=Popillia japonica TaxID=7064 RepID=A0AAW1KJA5_POPJA
MSIKINVYTVRNASLCTVTVPATATIKDVKVEIAKTHKKIGVERQSLRSDLKGKDIDNKTTLNTLGLENGCTIYVKDLGPQIGWRTVYLIEYLGPPIVYAIFASRPSLFYKNADLPMSTTAYIALGCWTAHYVKRLYESAFVHRFSHGTMPLRNLFKNCAYYWGFAGYVAAHVNHPLFTPPGPLQVAFGTSLFVLSELGNLSIHLLLRDLRPAGSTVRKIPVPNSNPLTQLYNFVSCPNYTYEFTAWLGFSILTSCIPALVFALAGMYQMTVWAINKHKAYKKEFKDYPRRKAIIPFVL